MKLKSIQDQIKNRWGFCDDVGMIPKSNGGTTDKEIQDLWDAINDNTRKDEARDVAIGKNADDITTNAGAIAANTGAINKINEGAPENLDTFKEVYDVINNNPYQQGTELVFDTDPNTPSTETTPEEP